MTRYRYETITDQDTDSLNRLLMQGWRPVRETVSRTGSGADSGEQVMVLLERDDELPIFSAETLPGGMLLEEFRQSDVFDGCADNEVREIIAACEVVRHLEGETVLSEDSEEFGLYMILSGEVEIHLPNVDSVPTEETLICTLGFGELFGEVSFFGEVNHRGVVLAKTDVRILWLRRESYEHLLQSESAAAVRLVLNISRLLAKRLHQTDHWIWSLLREEQNAKLNQNWRKFRENVRLSDDKPGGFFKAGWSFG